MKKRLKTSKKKHNKTILLFLFVFFLSFSFVWLLKHVYNNYIKNDNEIIVKLLLSDSIDSLNYNKLTDLKNPSYIFKYMLNQDLKELETIPVVSEINIVESNPLIYIYNSHPTETYKNTSLEAFSIVPTVVTASYILKEQLQNEGIYAIVEENSVTDILKLNGWRYGYSYKASRILLEDAINNNTSLKYFIDIHRDSSGHDSTYIKINNKDYAKILFVIGKEYNTYEKNLILAEALNNTLKKEYDGLSRGIITKSGEGVNGVYNQDINENCLLIEIGGQDNNLEEVNNTMQALAKVLSKYIGGTNG